MASDFAKGIMAQLAPKAERELQRRWADWCAAMRGRPAPEIHAAAIERWGEPLDHRLTEAIARGDDIGLVVTFKPDLSEL
ncbi:MAG TPA: hypothetical protein VGB14_10575 [Acidimicrobiales bacterium]